MRHAEDDIACEQLVELVTDYLEGALDDDGRTRVEMHLLACQGCETYVGQMRGTAATVAATDGEAPDPAAMDALLEAFRGWRERTLADEEEERA
jgi:anti-sigma factor RsiW